jgi:hypothetical protein
MMECTFNRSNDVLVYFPCSFDFVNFDHDVITFGRACIARQIILVSFIMTYISKGKIYHQLTRP